MFLDPYGLDLFECECRVRIAPKCDFGIRVLIEFWQGILTTLSQSNGGYKYDYATVPFLAEVFKVLYLFLKSYVNLVEFRI